MSQAAASTTFLDRLASDGPALSERVLADMYRDPFWQARFGDRGRHHSRADGDFHLKYLAESLVANDARVFDNYATWLRELLSSRGMCSRHLAENFTRLADAFEGAGWSDAQPAIDTLRGGARSLTYKTGTAAVIDALRAGTADEVDTLLSYLADALAFAQPSRFAAYVAFASTIHTDLDQRVAQVRALVTHIPEAAIIVRGVS